jgi:hypothetical protein
MISYGPKVNHPGNSISRKSEGEKMVARTSAKSKLKVMIPTSYELIWSLGRISNEQKV